MDEYDATESELWTRALEAAETALCRALSLAPADLLRIRLWPAPVNRRGCCCLGSRRRWEAERHRGVVGGDLEEAVVLRDALTARGRAGLQLTEA